MDASATPRILFLVGDALNHISVVLSKFWCVSQVGQDDLVAVDDCDLEEEKPTTEPFLSLDDRRWLHPSEKSGPPLKHDIKNHDLPLGSIRQPTPPPILAQVHSKLLQVYPYKVSWESSTSEGGLSGSRSYHDVHIPANMMEDFMRLARKNTAQDLETCGVLAGSLQDKVFHITSLIIPKQESTSNSCQTLNEEEIFYVQDSRSLFTLGWIHTHPTQTCFMSSVDLHTHYSYQVMLPEAIAIVMAPTDTSSPHGIFRLTDPGGVAVIRNCEQRGFHPHEELGGGNPIYEQCSHVYFNQSLKLDVVDLR
ncbi:AMSH-like ubiquitin thioesterase 3 [Striga hermonthica]|uniref:AMSH-like ubiquitin thioesterase 3 n=1 Tax=Striga hermonthica TaxID=68872 RepID=A0A9N7N9P1_STRHE|nr:AMSH-like ubiquitin thioesterase 3 [Striga hermonthica]